MIMAKTQHDIKLEQHHHNHQQERSSLPNQTLILSLNNYSSTSLQTMANSPNSRQVMQPSLNFMNTNQSELLIGIIYVQDKCISAEFRQSNEVPLGTIVIKRNVLFENAPVIREYIQNSLFKMDDNYIFLINLTYSIPIEQEKYVKVNDLISRENVIRFKRKTSPDRCSLIGYFQNNCGIFIGYFSTKFDSDLRTVRKKIDELIKDIVVHNVRLNLDYHFLYNIDCVINSKNETQMSLIDIIQNNCILIKFEKPCVNDSTYLLTNQDSPMKKFEENSLNNNNDQDQIDGNSKNRLKLIRRKTTKKKKQIMISYVRRESAENAILLKKTLQLSGFSVYLDVHEIQTGSDWQDSLNSAVQNCDYFVPLITQNYGRTQWTNREVKLADVLNKHIIPVNFLNEWPPECLAIQFATTQYIPWNQQLSEHSEISDGKISDDNEKSIEIVCNKIVGRIKKLAKSGALESSEKPTVTMNKSNANNSKDKQLIVISAHPEQLEVSNSIKELLKKENYDVWCSTDDSTNCKLSEINEEQLKDDLSLISEEPSHTITSQTLAFARKIAENSSKRRPKSTINPEKLNIQKKDLTRGFSLSNPSTSSISPEKMGRLQIFHQKLSDASLVIILASEQYYKSSTSQQHVFYCTERLKTIQIQYDKSPVPFYLSKLLINETHLNYEGESFEKNLLNKVKRILDPQCKEMENSHEIRIKCLADCMMKNIPNTETCIYVFGSMETASLEPRTATICKEIGKELAKIKNIYIVTNGMEGSPGDIVANTFYKERCRKQEKSDESVIHIVPEQYSKVSYGQTIFLGESTKERNSIIARMFDTSVLIGGEESAARETEEFTWNDHFVIPIQSTGGAAAGQFENVPQKIFDCPKGVHEDDWKWLSDTEALPNQVAKSIVKIISDLKKTILEHADSKNVSIRKSFSNLPKKRLANRRRLNGGSQNSNHTIDTSINYHSDEDKISSGSTTSDKFLPTFNRQSSLMSQQKVYYSSQEKFPNRFRRFLKTIIGRQ